MSFGECIRRVRESRRLSLVELANNARVSSRTLAMIETDIQFPRLCELERLLAVLKVNFPDLQSLATRSGRAGKSPREQRVERTTQGDA